jgi:hypothetical protein
MGPAGTNVVGRNADWLTVPTRTWEREAVVRRDLANPDTSATREGDYEFSQMTGLVVMRVAIAVPDWVRRCVERGVANAIACVGPCWSLRPDKSQALDRGTELAGWKAAEEVEEKISALLAAIEDVRPVTPRVLTALADSEETLEFHSEAFVAFFESVREELSDQCFSELEGHLARLRLEHGALFSAQLGPGNKPANLVLRRAPERLKRGFLSRAHSGTAMGTGFEIHPRYEAGMKALEDIQARGLAPVAVTVRRAAEHVPDFFEVLRAELAFYIGALNLRTRLVAKSEPLCFPIPLTQDELKFSARGLYDPALSLQQDAAVVANDLHADNKNLIVITGANQGGKSTFLRALGLATLMMLCGIFVPASAYSANVCRGVFTHFKAGEDSSMERGKLDEELARLSELVDGLSGNCLVLFNEPFASTNDREGSEIGLQVLRALCERDIKVAIVTHLFPMARALRGDWHDGALFLEAERLPTDERTYRIREGRPLPTSHGDDLYRRIFTDDPFQSPPPPCRM